jgi:DNA-binding MarR family transcriptional regulator
MLSGRAASYNVTECRRIDVDANFPIPGHRLFEISIDRRLARFQYDCRFHFDVPIYVHYTHTFDMLSIGHTVSKEISQLHNTLIDLVGFMNRPQRDTALIQEAGISLDRALFPLLMGIQRHGPIGVVELAELTGRDYTTVSRQVTKLESLGLIARRASKADKRVRPAVITAKGRAMAAALDEARQRLAAEVLANWNKKDLQDLARLMRRFADDLLAWRA